MEKPLPAPHDDEVIEAIWLVAARASNNLSWRREALLAIQGAASELRAGDPVNHEDRQKLLQLAERYAANDNG